jgi:site-specific DNA recombinase
MHMVKDCIDAGVSGATLERPALSELRDLVKLGQVDAVIVYDPDRLSRNFAHLMVLASEFDKAAVELAFVTDAMEKSPEGRMLFGMKGLFAEYERTKIVERTMRGKMRKARAGEQPGGRPPYGYRLVRGRHVIHEEEARIVRMIFEWLQKEGLSLRKIQSRLNDMAIPTRNGGKFWQRCVLHRIVREEAYAGHWHYNKKMEAAARYKKGATVQRLKPRDQWIHVPIPAIVSVETYDDAQRQLERNARFSPRNAKRRYLLSGMVVCGKCGYRYTGKAIGGRTYYRCNSRMGDITPASCDSSSIRGDEVEPLVWSAVVELLSNPQLIIDQMQKLGESGDGGHLGTSLATVNQTIEQKSRETDRLLEAYRVGAIDSELLKREVDKVRESERALVATKHDLEEELRVAEHRELDGEYIERFCGSISALLDNLESDDKMQVLREVVDKVVIEGDRVTVYGVIPASVDEAASTGKESIVSQSC